MLRKPSPQPPPSADCTAVVLSPARKKAAGEARGWSGVACVGAVERRTARRAVNGLGGYMVVKR